MKEETHLVNGHNQLEKLISELRVQKEKCIEIEGKLNKIQRLHDTMAHNFPDGVIGVLNKEMRYILVDGKELGEMHLATMSMTGEKSFPNQNPHLSDETLQKLRKAFDGENINCEVIIKDNIYEITAVPLTDRDNSVNEILCVLQNVTKRKRMEEGLVQALEKERELGELKSRFVTMASHEFRTPLTAILSSTFLLENYTEQDFEREKIVHTNRIKRSVNNLTVILNEFLSLEKLEENKVKVVHSDINIPEFINDFIWEMEVLKKDEQTIKYDHKSTKAIMSLDHHLLGSIVTNLISNALKYSKRGDKIEITSEIKNNILTLTVKDPGIGIPVNEHKHIFGRFYRASNAINFEGTGLGLHIVQKYVNLLKGTISFESEQDLGTKFSAILPAGKHQKQDNPAPILKKTHKSLEP
ncbi:MAG: ATP-binding protein [Cyclobacteriaceae bacterium]